RGSRRGRHSLLRTCLPGVEGGVGSVEPVGHGSLDKRPLGFSVFEEIRRSERDVLGLRGHLLWSTSCDQQGAEGKASGDGSPQGRPSRGEGGCLHPPVRRSLTALRAAKPQRRAPAASRVRATKAATRRQAE